MMHSTLVAALLSSLLVATVNAQGATCNATTACPKSAPCCSEFGFCGTGTFCLGGCNPLHSYSIDSCEPNPVCRDAKHVFTDNSRVLSNATFFDGNASAYDWVVDSGQIINTNSSGGELGMLLTQTNGGTRLSSTRYVHYGKITATLKTGRWGGVVTAFITMSNIKDEIDWEFPGNATTEGQTNFFWQGIVPSITSGTTAKDLTDTFSNYHDYSIDWQPDTLNFLIDGNVVRSVKKSDTVDDQGVAHYPSTPSRIQLSIWPAGISSSPPGVVEWAGGMINWNDPDYKSAGHFYALVKSVEVKCNDPQAPAQDITSYIYGSNSSASTPSVAFSNQSTQINGMDSLLGVKGVMNVKSISAIVGGAVGAALFIGF